MPQADKKLNQGLKTQNKTNKKKMAVPRRERFDNKQVSENQIHKNLDLGRKQQREKLPSSLDQALQSSKRANSHTNSNNLCWLLTVVPGSTLQAPKQIA